MPDEGANVANCAKCSCSFKQDQIHGGKPYFSCHDNSVELMQYTEIFGEILRIESLKMRAMNVEIIAFLLVLFNEAIFALEAKFVNISDIITKFQKQKHNYYENIRFKLLQITFTAK